MGKLKINYLDKKVIPFGGMKLLKDFMDQTTVPEDPNAVAFPQLGSNAELNPSVIIQGFWMSIFTGASRHYVHADWLLRYDETLQEIGGLMF